MNTLKFRIRERRSISGLTLAQLADLLGVKEATVQRYESGEIKNIKHETILKMAEIFKCQPEYLMGWSNNPYTAEDVELSDHEKHLISTYRENSEMFEKYGLIPIDTNRIPMLGEIACGMPSYAVEQRESYVELGTAVNADFCLRAKGDSMINARINSGDIIFVRSQPSVNNGEIAVVIVNDDATLKRVYYYPEQKKLVLQAENPKYEPFVYVGEELSTIRILGKAVAFQSDVI